MPFNGTVTSFSVNSGSSSGSVELRVLRPAGGGKYTGAGTSPPEPLNGTTSTYNVSLPVRAGDILGLDNDSSALVFDTTSPTPITAYYEPASAGPSGLPDGTTAQPNNNKSGYRLLLSATVQQSTTTTTTTTGTTTTTTTTTAPPQIANPRQSHKTWREGNKLPKISRVRAPVGTTFSFVLNEPARVSLSFTQHTVGRRVGGKCKPQTAANRRKPRCQHAKLQGTLRFNAGGGTVRVQFQGRLPRKKLPLGSYTAQIIAADSLGHLSNAAALAFTIVK